jgi:Glycosyl hydrolase family 14
LTQQFDQGTIDLELSQADIQFGSDNIGLSDKHPDNSEYYSSRPHEKGFFCDKGHYDNYYGHFFSQMVGYLINHIDQVLSLARLAFDGIVVTKVIPNLDFRFYWHFIDFIRTIGIAKFAIISQKCRNRTLMSTTSI